MKKHDKEALASVEPSLFLFEKLNTFMEYFSFIELTQEKHETLPHYGFRIVPHADNSIETNIQNVLNSYPEFFMNRVLPYLHYYVSRGDIFTKIDSVILVVVYFDYIAKYKIDLFNMDFKSPISLNILENSVIASIEKMGQILDVSKEITTVNFNDPTHCRDFVLNQVKMRASNENK